MSVQYTGECAVQREMFSTPGGIVNTVGEYHDKCGEGHWENN